MGRYQVTLTTSPENTNLCENFSITPDDQPGNSYEFIVDVRLLDLSESDEPADDLADMLEMILPAANSNLFFNNPPVTFPPQDFNLEGEFASSDENTPAEFRDEDDDEDSRFIIFELGSAGASVEMRDDMGRLATITQAEYRAIFEIPTSAEFESRNREIKISNTIFDVIDGDDTRLVCENRVLVKTERISN